MDTYRHVYSIAGWCFESAVWVFWIVRIYAMGLFHRTHGGSVKIPDDIVGLTVVVGDSTNIWFGPVDTIFTLSVTR